MRGDGQIADAHEPDAALSRPVAACGATSTNRSTIPSPFQSVEFDVRNRTRRPVEESMPSSAASMLSPSILVAWLRRPRPSPFGRGDVAEADVLNGRCTPASDLSVRHIEEPLQAAEFEYPRDWLGGPEQDWEQA